MDTRLVKASGEQRLMEWAQLVVECRSSKLSRKEWCAQHGISERKYHYWQKRVFDCAIIQRESTTMAIMTSVSSPFNLGSRRLTDSGVSPLVRRISRS